MNKINYRRAMSILALLGIFSLCVVISGCEPLRKKFVREKKRDKIVREEPVLEPIEYPSSPYDAYSDYANRYSLFHVWKKEFISGIDDQETSKRLRYFLDQMIGQLEEMVHLLREEKSLELAKDMQDLYPIRDQLDSLSYLYYLSKMKRKVNSITQSLRSQYNPSSVREQIK